MTRRSAPHETRTNGDERVRACVDDIGFIMQRMRARAVRESAWVSLDLSMAQVKTLMVLVLEPAGVTSRELAQRLDIGPSAVTPVVDKLVAQKLVARADDPADRRVVRIAATPKAHALLEKLQLASRNLWTELLCELPPADLAQVHKGIAVLAAAVRRRDGAKGGAR